MSDELYTFLSLLLRYWFAGLGVVIVLLAFRWLRQDRRAAHRRLRELPDAGMIGRFLVLNGSAEVPDGTWLDIPREGTLGFVRTCDVPLPCSGVANRHLDLTWIDRQGLQVMPRGRLTCAVDGETLTRRSAIHRAPLGHGAVLEVGDAVLRLYLFEGLELPRSPRLMDELKPDAPAAPGQNGGAR